MPLKLFFGLPGQILASVSGSKQEIWCLPRPELWLHLFLSRRVGLRFRMHRQNWRLRFAQTSGGNRQSPVQRHQSQQGNTSEKLRKPEEYLDICLFVFQGCDWGMKRCGGRCVDRHTTCNGTCWDESSRHQCGSNMCLSKYQLQVNNKTNKAVQKTQDSWRNARKFERLMTELRLCLLCVPSANRIPFQVEKSHT